MNLTLVFQIDDRSYGLDIDVVREIVEQPVRYPIPAQVPFLKEVVNVHGDVLPVIDLPGLMNAATAGRDGRLIVLTPTGRSLALEVDRIIHIRQLARDAAPGDTAQAAGPDPYSREIIALPDENTTVRMLDLDAIYEQLEQMFADHGGSYAPASDDCR